MYSKLANFDDEVEVTVTIKIKTTIRVSNLKELYGMLYTYIKNLFNDVEPDILIQFSKPLEIPLTKDEVRKLYEDLMTTDSQLNCETARKLFGKEFSRTVSEHNRKIRMQQKP